MSDKTNGSGNDRRSSWLIAGGVLGTFLASSCCILPLILISVGVTGAWIGQLTQLEPYKPVFMLIAAGFLQLAFGKSIFGRAHCEDSMRIHLWNGPMAARYRVARYHETPTSSKESRDERNGC